MFLYFNLYITGCNSISQSSFSHLPLLVCAVSLCIGQRKLAFFGKPSASISNSTIAGFNLRISNNLEVSFPLPKSLYSLLKCKKASSKDIKS